MTPWFETSIRVRSYELDAFGHLNHSVYLNYFEEARVRTLEEVGHPLQELLDRGGGVHVVRVEVDYRRQVFLGDRLRIRTRVDEVKRSSIAVVQEALRDVGDRGGRDRAGRDRVNGGRGRDGETSAAGGPEVDASREPEGSGHPGRRDDRRQEVACRARVVWVWVDETGRPQRVPTDFRDALLAGPEGA